MFTNIIDFTKLKKNLSSLSLGELKLLSQLGALLYSALRNDRESISRQAAYINKSVPAAELSALKQLIKAVHDSYFDKKENG